MVPIHGVTKALTGGVAFAIGQTLDVNPRLKVGSLPVKVRRPFSRVLPSLSQDDAGGGWGNYLQGNGSPWRGSRGRAVLESEKRGFARGAMIPSRDTYEIAGVKTNRQLQ